MRHETSPDQTYEVDDMMGVEVRCVADVESKPVRWMWPGRIARGKLTLIAGNPGLGKSQVTIALAATVTTGGEWPVDGTRCERGSVLMLSAEDDVADTIKPRLEAAGADVSRVHVLDAVLVDDGRRTFDISRDVDRLGDQLKRMDDVALVVIDPISAYLGNTDSHRNSDVRAVLAPLSELAAAHEVAVILVSHLNKSTGGDALSRVTGSIAFTAAVRAAYIVTKDGADSARRLFLPVKNNIGVDDTGFAFRIESANVDGIYTSRVEWEPEVITTTADEALASTGGAGGDAVSEACAMLQDVLADGPVSVNDVKSEADEAGLAWRTVRRASDKLGIVKTKSAMHGGWSWALPKVAKSPEGGQVQKLDKLAIFGKVGDLRGVKVGENEYEVEL